jgi:CRP-like cAMP-binding protein
MQKLLNQIEDVLHRLPSPARAAMQDIMTQEKLPKGHFLLQEGQYCRHLYWLQSGLARSYVLHEGKEITTNFAFAEELIFSLQSAVMVEPSREYIQLIEGGEVTRLDWTQFKKLTRQHPALAELDTLLSDYYAIQLEKRLLDLQTLSAKERYLKLLTQEQRLVAQVPLTYLASYLGISLETLSRIRSSAG